MPGHQFHCMPDRGTVFVKGTYVPPESRSVYVDEFICIQQHATEPHQRISSPFCTEKLSRVRLLAFRRFAPESNLECSADLPGLIIAHLMAQALGEMRRLAIHKVAVIHGERLQGRDRVSPAVA